jgi:hypothetical protein
VRREAKTRIPFSVGIRDGVVHLVSTLGSAVISARAELPRRGGGRAIAPLTLPRWGTAMKKLRIVILGFGTW